MLALQAIELIARTASDAHVELALGITGESRDLLELQRNSDAPDFQFLTQNFGDCLVDLDQ